jgi:hypothetical protein
MLTVGGNKQFSAGRTNKLAEEHSKFLVEYIDERLAALLFKSGTSWVPYLKQG